MTNREEVAEWLRVSGKWLDRREISTTRDALVSIEQGIGVPNDREFSLLFNRLADLIDPTCFMVIALDQDVSSEKEPTGVCSNCEHFKSDYGEFPEAFNYCPACGARVMRDE